MIQFLAKTTVPRGNVSFPCGREVTFIPNHIFELSDAQVDYLKKSYPDVFSNLLMLRTSKPKPAPVKVIPEPVVEPVVEQDAELDKYLEDEPTVKVEDLVKVDVVEGEEPKPKKRQYKKRNKSE